MERKLGSALRFNVRQITTIGMLSAISIVLGMTPLGFIPIPPVNATIMHIPVIIGAILEGPAVGAMIGLIFGIFSIIQAITRPTVLSFMFINPVVSVLPRIIIGITSYYAYRFIKLRSEAIKIGIGALIGSLTNTIGVLGFIYLIYVDRYAQALKISTSAAAKGIFSIGAVNGIPEAVISILITVPVVQIVKKVRR